MTTDIRGRRDMPAGTATQTKAPRPASGLSTAEIRQIVLDILG